MEQRKDSESRGEATATVTGPGSPAPAAPTEFPVDFAEWASPKRDTPWRLLVAGFEHDLKSRGALEKARLNSEWDALFAAFQTSERG